MLEYVKNLRIWNINTNNIKSWNENSGLLLQGVSETIQNKGKEQKAGFLRMLLGHAMINNVSYFDSFGAEHISKEIQIIFDKSIVVTNIFRTQEYDSVMCGYFKVKILTDFTNLSSLNNFY